MVMQLQAQGAAGAPANIDTTYENAGLGTGVGTTVTANASTNTMGNWAELTAATTGAWAGFWIFLHVSSTASARFLVDIGIGAAAAETVLVPGIPVTPATAGNGMVALWVPLNVAAGSRLSARCQSGTGSATIVASLMGEIRTANHAPLFNSCERISTTPSGTYPSNTDVTMVTTANTGWTEIEDSTVRAYGAIMAIAGIRSSTTAPTTAQQFSLRLALGAAASEVLFFRVPTSTLSAAPVGGRQPGILCRKSIASGQRISAELLAATAAAGDVLSVWVVGFY